MTTPEAIRNAALEEAARLAEYANCLPKCDGFAHDKACPVIYPEVAIRALKTQINAEGTPRVPSGQVELSSNSTLPSAPDAAERFAMDCEGYAPDAAPQAPSETPETDAQEKHTVTYQRDGVVTAEFETVAVEFAARLERERDELKRKLAVARNDLVNANLHIDADSAEIDALTERAERAEAALAAARPNEQIVKMAELVAANPHIGTLTEIEQSRELLRINEKLKGTL
jgi:hypothetical protein